MKILISLSLLLFTRFILIDGESTSIETYFESTNHPDNYPNNHSEEWMLEINDGSKINLTFITFEVEFDPFGDCGFDYVEISFGNFNEKYCGTSLPGPFISNTTITVKFQSDDFYNMTGFRAMWTEIIEAKKTSPSTVKYFESPNHPENYPNNHSEEWTLEVNDGDRINLTFISFEVEFDPFGECGFDYVEVSNGNFIEKYCGTSLPGPFFSNRTITVKFHSDDFYNMTGFRAAWTVVKEVMHSTPTSTPSGNTVKYFESPNHPENYPNNHSEEWNLEVGDGNRINLTFTSFEVEFDPFGDCGFDHVEVSYGNFSKRYCGLSVPGPFISNTTITVKFNSDDFYNETGFRAMWAVIQEEKTAGDQCWTNSTGATGVCAPGTYCGPWTPEGGAWDGLRPWHCLYTPPLAEGQSCDYNLTTHLCEPDLTCHNQVCQAIPAGGQCWSLSQGASAQKCTTGSQCLPWLPDGGTWDGIAPKFCVYIAPLTYRQPCNYTERTQLCVSGLMCESGLCISSGKYKLNKWRIGGHDSYKRVPDTKATLNFIRNFLKWKSQYKDYIIDNCFLISFGSNMDGVAAISVDLHTDVDKFYMYPERRASKNDFRWTEHRPNLHDSLASDNCFLVFIGDNYIDFIDKVLKKVEKISKSIGLQPLGLFVTSDHVHVDTTNAIYPLIYNVFQLHIRESVFKGVSFHLKCPGHYSTHPSKLMMIQNGTIRDKIKYIDICNGKIPVTVAYHNIPEVFDVDKERNAMVEQDIHNSSNVRFEGEHSRQSFDWEILKLFFLEHNIILNWTGPCNEKGFILDEKGLRREYGYIGECKGGWGDYDYDTESWTGVIGQIETNQADLGVFGLFCTYKRSKVSHCTPAVEWRPLHWWTRYPQEKGMSSVGNYDYNIVRLTLLTIPVVLICLKLLTYFGQSLGLPSTLQQIPFYPFPFRGLDPGEWIPICYGYNIIILAWNIASIFIWEGLMTVLLESMVAIDFEDKMNTAQQLVENNITLYFFSDMGDFWKEELLTSPDPWHNKLAVTAKVFKYWWDFFRMTKAALRDGTSVMMTYRLDPEVIRMGVQYNQGMGWHKSTEGVGNNPVKGYLTNKKWMLNEDFSVHLLNFQQAGLTSMIVPFEEWDPDSGTQEESEDEGHSQQNFTTLQLTLILYGIIVALSFLKLGTNIVQRFWKSKSWTNHTSRTMDFCELLKFYSCFIPSTMALALVLYFYNVNYIQCPTTFYKYQFKYCECDLVERNYHIQDQPSEFELNNFCNERYNTENIFYLNTTILFSQYLPETYNAGQKDLSAMMISGEYAVEVISPTGALSCTLPPLPFQQFGHTHNKNIICGGTNPLDDEGQFCYNLTSSGWKKSHTLLYGRTGHTSWDVDEGVMLLGGHGSRTTEIAKWDGSTVETFRLKYQTFDACAIPDGDSVVLTGGMMTLNKVSWYQMDQGWVKDLPELKFGRYYHGCASFTKDDEQVYLVAGGQDGCEYCSYFSSTEIFSRGQWTIVGPLPEPLRGVRGVTVENSVFMTGGTDHELEFMSDIWKFDPNTGEWILAIHMRKARSFHGVGVVKYNDYCGYSNT